jgi:hypothetical protein
VLPPLAGTVTLITATIIIITITITITITIVQYEQPQVHMHTFKIGGNRAADSAGKLVPRSVLPKI